MRALSFITTIGVLSLSALAGPLSKRYSDAQFTWYDVGYGACGYYNTGNQYVVALSPNQYDSGAKCGDTITVYYGGNSAQATVVDECPTCPSGGLDMSTGLFSYFAPLSDGVIYGSWNFN